MNDQSLINFLFLQSGYNTAIVVIGTSIFGLASGTIGSLVLLRQRSLIGDALSHGTLPGIGLAFLYSTLFGDGEKNLFFLLIGATITGVAAIFSVHLITKYTRISEDSAIGIVLSTFFGLGVTLVSVIEQLDGGNIAGLNHFIYGQAAAMQIQDVLIMSIIAVVATVLAAIFFKEFRLICFDPNFAATDGWRVELIDLIMLSLVVLIVIAGLQAVGMIMVIALLIIPPATAKLWTDKMSVLVLLAAVFGAFSGYSGSILSAAFPNVPTGSIIVLCATFMFLVSILVAKDKGLISRGTRLIKLRLKVALDHLLLEAGESFQQKFPLELLNPQHEVPLIELPILRTWSPLQRNLIFSYGKIKALFKVNESRATVNILPNGLTMLNEIVKIHQQWEEYLIKELDFDSEHAHLSADRVEHIMEHRSESE